MNRRAFVKTAVQGSTSAALVLLGLSSLAALLKRDAAPRRLATEPPVLRPPGALEESSFLSACIRCQRCRDSCPVACIQLAGSHDPAAPGTPFLVATERACILCLECTRVCPTGALMPLEEIPQVAMGVAVVDPRTCVAINRSGVCGACHTACPLKNRAISLGLHNAPTVHEDECVGCGLCEEACILQGTKAIRVFSGRAVA
ncbi:4Fe-4S dicluster domain-containing protein [bacterium]|nr:4Fe-4S dicluster domain-containing protein [bacterium]